MTFAVGNTNTLAIKLNDVFIPVISNRNTPETKHVTRRFPWNHLSLQTAYVVCLSVPIANAPGQTNKINMAGSLEAKLRGPTLLIYNSLSCI